MTAHPYADCPACNRRLPVETSTAPAVLDTFPDHRRLPVDLDNIGERCEASGWIVEDEDRCSGRWPR